MTRPKMRVVIEDAPQKVRPIFWRKRLADVEMGKSLRELQRLVRGGGVKAMAIVLVDKDRELAYGTIGSPAWAELLAGVTSLQVSLATDPQTNVHPGTKGST